MLMTNTYTCTCSTTVTTAHRGPVRMYGDHSESRGPREQGGQGGGGGGGGGNFKVANINT